MASLLHIIDEKTLKTDPNLKFDPQNAAAFLNKDHPNFKDFQNGLTPEQLELIHNVSSVDGLGINEDEDEIDPDEHLDLINPDTGESIHYDDEYSLEELGFVDPTKLRNITMEAFNAEQLHHVNQVVHERYHELTAMRKQLLRTGHVSRLQADNIHAMLGNTLYDNVVMESFTQLPTKVNFNLVMEELTAGQTAMAVGGAITGMAIVYKLVKWCLNSWNKNSVASGSIASNIKNIQERGDRLKNAPDIINNSKKALDETIASLQKATANSSDGVKSNALREYLATLNRIKNQNIGDANAAMAMVNQITQIRASIDMQGIYSNMWLSISTTKGVSLASGSNFIADTNFWNEIEKLIANMSALMEFLDGRAQAFINVGADKSITEADAEYKKHLDAIKVFGGRCGFNNTSEDFYEYCNGLSNHILEFISKPLGAEFKIEATPSAAGVGQINPRAFAGIDDDYLKDVNHFADEVKQLSESKKEIKVLGVTAKQGQQDQVNKGEDVQRDSRVREYELLIKAFRGHMSIMRGLHDIRNNLGRGLVKLNNAANGVDKLLNGKGGQQAIANQTQPQTT